MRAFAVPSLHNGIVRLNVKGRERDGVVDPAEYQQVLSEFESILMECEDTATGGSPIRAITFPGNGDPFAVNESQGDLVVHWKELVQGVVHPKFGQIGPLPIWRTGGHTGDGGRLMILSDRFKPGDYGKRSSYDVAPTIVDLLEGRALNRMDGESVIPEILGASPDRQPDIASNLRAGLTH